MITATISDFMFENQLIWPYAEGAMKPLAIAAALAVEFAILVWALRGKSALRIALVVIGANLCSTAIGYTCAFASLLHALLLEIYAGPTTTAVIGVLLALVSSVAIEAPLLKLSKLVDSWADAFRWSALSNVLSYMTFVALLLFAS